MYWGSHRIELLKTKRNVKISAPRKTMPLFMMVILMICVPCVLLAIETMDDFYFDSGLYWHGYDEQKERYVPGWSNRYYDPSKPTVIYFHGWHQDHVKKGYQKANLHFQHNDIDVYTHNNWIDQGWNVGIFHWEQWADEGNVLWAEAKIWTTNGPKGMRVAVLQQDGSVGYEYLSDPKLNRPVSVQAAEQIIKALHNYRGDNIRFVGHSLGNQLATATAKIIYDNILGGKIHENRYRLQRLALLEPAWTKNGKDWWPDGNDLNGDGKKDWVGERCRWAIYDMIERWTDSHDFVVEIYNTTPLEYSLFGVAMDNNYQLRERVMGTVSVSTWYYPSWQLIKKHNIANRHYFWSMAFPPPAECKLGSLGCTPTLDQGPSAATSKSWIKEMMSTKHSWVQVEGRYTETPEDDWFKCK